MDTCNAVVSFLFPGKASKENAPFNGPKTKRASAFPGATGTTHEVCFNASPDAPLSRSKSGNVRTSKGGSDVDHLNCVTTSATYEASEYPNADIYTAESSFVDREVIVESSYVNDHADPTTLCGSSSSTNPAC